MYRHQFQKHKQYKLLKFKKRILTQTKKRRRKDNSSAPLFFEDWKAGWQCMPGRQDGNACHAEAQLLLSYHVKFRLDLTHPKKLNLFELGLTPPKLN